LKLRLYFEKLAESKDKASFVKTGITFKRVTPSFFAVSSVRKDRIWYNRCNRAAGYMNCILINYPRAEKLQWDGIVTRISLTLAR